MLVVIKWNQKVRFKPIIIFIGFVNMVFNTKLKHPNFCILTDDEKSMEECLCDKCNTNYKGHYGVGYYPCKNTDKVIRI